MSKWSRTFGLLFTAVMSVYADQALSVNSATAANPTPAAKSSEAIKVIDEPADPFVNTAAEPATKPSEGQSVTATDVSVNDTGTVEIHVNDANLVEVLRMLSMQSQKNIVASNQVTGRVTANLYGVTVREALDAILHANGYAYREKGNFVYVYTTKEIADIEKSELKPATEVFRLFYTPAANAVTMIKPVLSAEAQVSSTTPAASGLSTGTGDSGGTTHSVEDLIVVTDFPDNLEKVRKILAEVDRRPQQILIEATILRASLSEDNALGVDFQILGGVDFSTITGGANGQFGGASLTNPVKVDGTSSSIGTGNAFSSTVGNGLKVGIVSNNVAVFLSALESVTDTTVLANPKVLALNKQKGEVIVGRQDGYITTTVTENAQTQTVQFLETGTRLVFRPYIGDDGYIRMEVHPEDSSGGINASAANLPFKITTEVTSNIMVKDGHTIVIGGLFRESSDTAKSQIPVLGNLPLAGPLFRQQRDTSHREEVIILLTPHIVKDDNVYSKASEDALKELEKLRVGVRHGMMPWGRERMAESCYETAINEMNKAHPDRSKALWFLDCATNLNPKYLEAINLKQNITGKELTTSDNSSVHHFLTQQVLAERANPPAARPMQRVVPISPSSQPVSVAPANPTTRPVVALNDQPAALPSSQPAALPSSQPAAVAELPTDDAVDAISDDRGDESASSDLNDE